MNANGRDACGGSRPRPARNTPHAAAGFSLIEIIVVIIIITIFASIVAVNVINKPAEVKVDAARIQMTNFQTALQLYKLKHGRFPTREQGLEALVQKPGREPIPENYPPGGYLDSARLPKDPWDHDYIYLAPGREERPYEIISYGSDGEPDGAGDAADISSAYL